MVRVRVWVRVTLRVRVWDLGVRVWGLVLSVG